MYGIYIYIRKMFFNCKLNFIVELNCVIMVIMIMIMVILFYKYMYVYIVI